MKAAAALAPDGVFDRALENFTPRVAQCEMAQAVEDSLQHGGRLVVESATGTGKTFAYLAPIVVSGKRTIISTATKHLQEQLFHRDLPQVAKVLGAPLDAVLLKGRANYLCKHRLAVHTRQSELIGEAETHSFDAIEKWAVQTADGDIAEVAEIGEDSPLWKLVTSTTDNCLGGECPDFKDCWVNKARKRAMKADVVVVNHHLFFSDLTMKLEGFGELLPQAEAVVFDEAHAIADIASDFFGFALSTAKFGELTNDVKFAERDEKSGVDFGDSARELNRAGKAIVRVTEEFAGRSVDEETLQSDAFERACSELTHALAAYEVLLQKAARKGEALQRCHERCLQLQENLDAWLHQRDGDWVQWAQIGHGWVNFCATPLRIDERFTEMMQQNRVAWVFTSATLAVGDDFTAFCARLGLSDEAETRRFDSQYDYANNALLYLPPHMPEPREREFESALCKVIEQVVGASRGRAFCLFTSIDMMKRAHQNFAARADWSIFLQGEAPKQELLARYRSAEQAVLFATASFWQGVDVAGERLSCVIIDKLPFAAPSDPVLKSRLRACEQDGGNPFRDIQIPAAVTALKQGAGRLIRSETDRGVLVLCDPRVVSKSYGRSFINSLPKMRKSKSIEQVRAFFNE